MSGVKELSRADLGPAASAIAEEHVLAVHRSRKRISPFRLHRPGDAAEAVQLLHELPQACLVAGGIDVVNRMKCGDRFEHVISIGRIGALCHIDLHGTTLRVGAACTHDQVATSDVVRRAVPALARVWSSIANPRIRFKGTVGGNVMARHPDYEAEAILSAIGATLCFATREGPCILPPASPARDQAGGLLEGFSVPVERDLRVIHDRSLKGIAGVVLAVAVDGHSVLRARASTAWSHPATVCADLPLSGMPLADVARNAADIARDWAGKLPEPLPNHLASARYRKRILEIGLKRALQSLQ
ncbi:MAG: FAD binding domain-containing protein [Pseudorhodoplanes sp.]